MRKKLVETIKSNGIYDLNVLNAISSIPRHWFMDSSFISHAYEDKPFPIGSGQTISQPYTVAFQTQLLDIKKGDKVLEIGTGSGYQTCVLIELGAKVYTIERQRKLYLRTKDFLYQIGYIPRQFKYGDGYKGLPAFAPFEKIIITAGAIDVPPILKEQLKIGGIMIVPVGGNIQEMKKITRLDNENYKEENHGTFRFVPLLDNKADD